MESWVSSNCTRNIYRPSTPEKEVNREENTLGKINNRRQIATDSKVYACSDTDFGEVLFYYVLFCDKENRDLSSKIYRVSFGGTKTCKYLRKFRLLNDRLDRFHKLWKLWELLPKKIEENRRQSQKVPPASASLHGVLVQ